MAVADQPDVGTAMRGIAARRHGPRPRWVCAWFLQSIPAVWPTIAAEHMTYLQTNPGEERRPSSGRLLALVVSSDGGVQDILQATLRAHGHSVVCAADLDMARAVVRQASPHVLIADLGATDLARLRPHLAPSTGIVELSDGSRSNPAPHECSPVMLPRTLEPGAVVSALHRAHEHARAGSSTGGA